MLKKLKYIAVSVLLTALAAQAQTESTTQTGQHDKANNTCDIALCFDMDAEALWTDAIGVNSPTALSRGAYGPKVGLPRILDLLDKYEIKATFFIPGSVIENYPDQVREIHARGHELGHHGYNHISPVNLTLEEEREQLRKGLEVYQNIVGIRPRGYRSPSWDMSPNSFNLLQEFGFTYDSSMMENDFHPYYPSLNGTQYDLVELPVSWELDDAPHFLFNVFPAIGPMKPASELFEIWREEFNGAYAENGIFVLTMHPQIIGRWSRLRMLELFIQSVRHKRGVSFKTCGQIADAWLENTAP